MTSTFNSIILPPTIDTTSAALIFVPFLNRILPPMGNLCHLKRDIAGMVYDLGSHESNTSPLSGHNPGASGQPASKALELHYVTLYQTLARPSRQNLAGLQFFW
jgi:hypothetical protein